MKKAAQKRPKGLIGGTFSRPRCTKLIIDKFSALVKFYTMKFFYVNQQ